MPFEVVKMLVSLKPELRLFARTFIISGLTSLAPLASRVGAASVTQARAQFDHVWTRENGAWVQTGSNPLAIGPNLEVYDNSTNFAGYVQTQDPSGPVNGVQTSTMIADDLTLDPDTVVGSSIWSFRFSIFNINSSTRSISPHVSFFLADGPLGVPGTLVAAFQFNPISVASFDGGFVTVTLPPADQFPVPANRKLWAAETFANDLGSTSSDAEVDNWSQGYYDPPTIGSSADLAFQTLNPFDGFSSDPDGALFNWGGNPVVANFGWQLQAPEPASVWIAGLAMLGFASRGRRIETAKINGRRKLRSG